MDDTIDENQRGIANIQKDLKNMYKMSEETYINIRAVKGPPRKPNRVSNTSEKD